MNGLYRIALTNAGLSFSYWHIVIFLNSVFVAVWGDLILGVGNDIMLGTQENRGREG